MKKLISLQSLRKRTSFVALTGLLLPANPILAAKVSAGSWKLGFEAPVAVRSGFQSLSLGPSVFAAGIGRLLPAFQVNGSSKLASTHLLILPEVSLFGARPFLKLQRTSSPISLAWERAIGLDLPGLGLSASIRQTLQEATPLQYQIIWSGSSNRPKSCRLPLAALRASNEPADPPEKNPELEELQKKISEKELEVEKNIAKLEKDKTELAACNEKLAEATLCSDLDKAPALTVKGSTLAEHCTQFTAKQRLAKTMKDRLVIADTTNRPTFNDQLLQEFQAALSGLQNEVKGLIPRPDTLNTAEIAQKRLNLLIECQRFTETAVRTLDPRDDLDEAYKTSREALGKQILDEIFCRARLGLNQKNLLDQNMSLKECFKDFIGFIESEKKQAFQTNIETRTLNLRADIEQLSGNCDPSNPTEQDRQRLGNLLDQCAALLQAERKPASQIFTENLKEIIPSDYDLLDNKIKQVCDLFDRLLEAHKVERRLLNDFENDPAAAKSTPQTTMDSADQEPKFGSKTRKAINDYRSLFEQAIKDLQVAGGSNPEAEGKANSMISSALRKVQLARLSDLGDLLVQLNQEEIALQESIGYLPKQQEVGQWSGFLKSSTLYIGAGMAGAGLLWFYQTFSSSRKNKGLKTKLALKRPKKSETKKEVSMTEKTPAPIKKLTSDGS